MYQYKAYVNRVVDGDTYDVNIDLGFCMVKQSVRIRLHGIDTPESWRPLTEAEKQHGEQATQFVKNLIENKEIILDVLDGKPDIFGRYTAKVQYRISESDSYSYLSGALRANGFEKKESY